MSNINIKNRLGNKYSLEAYFYVLIICLTIFFMSYSEGIHETPKYNDYHRILIIMALYLFGISLVKNGKIHFKSNLGKSISIVFMLLLLSILASSLVGNLGHVSSMYIVIWHLSIYVFWILLLSRDNCSHFIYFKISLLSFSFFALLALIIGLYIKHVTAINIMNIVIEQPIHGGVEHPQLFSWFSSPNKLGPFLMYGIIATITVYPFIANKKLKTFLSITVFTLSTGILLVGSRSAILATIFYFLIISLPKAKKLIKAPMKAKHIILIILSCSIIIYSLSQIYGGFINILYHSRMRWLLNLDAESFLGINRFPVFKAIINDWVDVPLSVKVFGGGPGFVMERLSTSPHSGWLEILTSYGIVSFVFVAIIISLLFIKCIYRFIIVYKNDCVKDFYLSQGAFWVAFAVINITTSIMTIPILDGFFMLLMLAQFAYIEFITKS